jgi:hypothetical protein
VSTLDYAPALNGAPYDPAPAGGSVLNLQLFTDAARTGPEVYNAGLPTVVSAGLYRFEINDAMVPAGRYWVRVLWTPDSLSASQADDITAPLDLPVREDMVVTPEELGLRLGLDLPLADAARDALTQAILDAQTDTEAYLGRVIVPQIITERRLFPPGNWVLGEQPVLELLSETEILDTDGWPTGWWDVSYRGGLNARTDQRLRPIRRVVLAQAAQSDEAYRLWVTEGHGAADDGTGRKQIRSVSAESQSVSYDFAKPGQVSQASSSAAGGDGGPVGGPVRWASIDQWRIRGRRVYQRTGDYGPLTRLRMM